jgi:hypothetical protein
MSRGGAPGGGAVVLDVAQLEALFTRTFSIGLVKTTIGRAAATPWKYLMPGWKSEP